MQRYFTPEGFRQQMNVVNSIIGSDRAKVWIQQRIYQSHEVYPQDVIDRLSSQYPHWRVWALKDDFYCARTNSYLQGWNIVSQDTRFKYVSDKIKLERHFPNEAEARQFMIEHFGTDEADSYEAAIPHNNWNAWIQKYPQHNNESWVLLRQRFPDNGE